MDPQTYQNDPREYALKLAGVDGIDGNETMAEYLLVAALKYMSHDDVRGMLDANELSPRFDDDDDN